MKVRVGLIAVFVIALSLMFAPPALAADGEDYGDVFGFLGWVARGAAGGVILSVLGTKSEWYKALPSNAKLAIMIGISVILPILARVALDLVPISFWEAIQPYWRVAVDGLLFMFAGSQIYYRTIGEGREAGVIALVEVARCEDEAPDVK